LPKASQLGLTVVWVRWKTIAPSIAKRRTGMALTPDSLFFAGCPVFFLFEPDPHALSGAGRK